MKALLLSLWAIRYGTERVISNLTNSLFPILYRYKSMAGMMLTGAAAIAYSIASKFEQYYHLFSGVGADTHVNRRRFTKKIYGQKSAKCQ